MPQNADNNGVIPTISYLVIDVAGNAKKFAIDDHLVIGSEHGPINIENTTLSKRHASLFVQDDVISIMDHRSEFGTFINGTKLLPGKMYVVMPEDELKFGELKGRLASGVREKLPDLPPDVTAPTKENLILNEDDVKTSSIKMPTIEDTEIDFNMPEFDRSEIKTPDALPGLKHPTGEREGSLNQAVKTKAPVQSDFPKEATKEINIESLLKESKGQFPGGKKASSQDEKVNALFSEDTDIKKLKLNGEGINWEEKTGVFKKLLHKIKPEKHIEEKNPLVPKKLRIKVPKQKVVKVERTFQVANALLRFFAVLIDIIVTYVLFESISSQDGIISLFKALETNVFSLLTAELSIHLAQIPVLGSWINLSTSAMLTFLHALTIYFLIRTVSAFIFGVSIGQFCLGMYSPGNSVGKRFSGLVREAISIATSFFIIFDLPTIFSKRSFKEVITGSKICSSSPALSTILVAIFIPFWLFVAMIFPLFNNFTPSPSWDVSDLNNGPTKSREVITEFSNYFSMGVPTIKDPFWMVPSINININDGKKILIPNLYFYHPELKKEVKWSIYKHISLGQTVSDALKLDPYAKKSFPIITELLKNVAIGTEVLQSNMTEEEVLKIRLELIDFIKYSLKLAPSNLLNHVTEFGPFISSYVNFKTSLSRFFGFPDPKFEFVFLGDMAFLKGSDKLGAQKMEVYMPIELGQVPLYRVTYPGGEVKEAFTKLAMNFSFNKGAAQTQSPSLNWIDKLSENDSNINEKLTGLLAYFKEEGKKAFDFENFDYLVLLEKALKQNHQGIIKLKETIPEDIEVKFQEMMLSFKDRDRFYFTGSHEPVKPPEPTVKEEVPTPGISKEEAEAELFGE